MDPKRNFSYDTQTGTLRVGDVPIAGYFGEAFIAPVDLVGNVLLSSFISAASSYRDVEGKERLVLRLSSMQIALFQERKPPPDGVWLESDGEALLIVFSGDVSRDHVPDEDSAVRELVALALRDHIRQHKLTLRGIDVRTLPYFQHATVALEYEWRRKSLHDAFALGQSLKAAFQRGSANVGSLTGVIGLLRGGAPALLVGAAESSWFEAKRRPHDLSSDPQKWEWAKDVAAFANSGGGLIVFGFAVRRASGQDVISAVSPFDLGAFDIPKARAVLRGRIVPQPTGLTFERVPIYGGTGVSYVHIPPQARQRCPFLVRGAATNGRVRSQSITIPTRTGDRTEFESIEEIHALIAAGRAVLA
jgi:hypothetical protein